MTWGPKWTDMALVGLLMPIRNTIKCQQVIPVNGSVRNPEPQLLVTTLGKCNLYRQLRV
jgi:hypothetical protein